VTFWERLTYRANARAVYSNIVVKATREVDKAALAGAASGGTCAEPAVLEDSAAFHGVKDTEG
jgi:hypothetical protein